MDEYFAQQLIEIDQVCVDHLMNRFSLTTAYSSYFCDRNAVTGNFNLNLKYCIHTKT